MRAKRRKGFYEFEARFGDFDAERFNALKMKLLEKSNDVKSKEWAVQEKIETIDFTVDGTRYTVKNVGDTKVFRASKDLLQKDVHKRVKYVLSLEGVNDKPEEEMKYEDGHLNLGDGSKKITLTRHKDRTTFFVGSDLRIDMTKVVEINVTGREATKYEVELEIECKRLQPKKNKVLFLKLVDIISQISPNYEDIIRFYNYSMTNRQKDTSEALIFGTVSRAPRSQDGRLDTERNIEKLLGELKGRR